jgi:hypothetical protein
MSRNLAILIEFFWIFLNFGGFSFSKSFVTSKNQIIKISRNSRNKMEKAGFWWSKATILKAG